MCFTINIHTTRNAIEKRFNTDGSTLNNFHFHYLYRAFENPLIPVIAQDDPARIQLMQWGLIPSWAHDPVHAGMIRKGTYNARSESIRTKPSFKQSVKNRRCLIIACGFFEWQHHGKQKIPWYIHHKDQALLAFAGVYDQWENPENSDVVQTFSIITTRANPLMEKIHNTKKRMPVLLPENQEQQWIDQSLSEKEADNLLLPMDEQQLNAYSVTNGISKPEYDRTSSTTLNKVDYPVEGTLF
ncbi:MAG: SOS response-associated peptidase [Bacteroidales bacterium]